jgi:hypothetical protein
MPLEIGVNGHSYPPKLNMSFIKPSQEAFYWVLRHKPHGEGFILLFGSH